MLYDSAANEQVTREYSHSVSSLYALVRIIDSGANSTRKSSIIGGEECTLHLCRHEVSCNQGMTGSRM